jgi:hypothetical protein
MGAIALSESDAALEQQLQIAKELMGFLRLHNKCYVRLVRAKKLAAVRRRIAALHKMLEEAGGPMQQFAWPESFGPRDALLRTPALRLVRVAA